MPLARFSSPGISWPRHWPPRSAAAPCNRLQLAQLDSRSRSRTAAPESKASPSRTCTASSPHSRQPYPLPPCSEKIRHQAIRTAAADEPPRCLPPASAKLPPPPQPPSASSATAVLPPHLCARSYEHQSTAVLSN